MNDYEREWSKQLAAESKYIRERARRQDSKLNRLLESKVPDKLQSTLDAAFAKAFELIFEKGTVVIEKSYNRKDIERSGQVRRAMASNNPRASTLKDTSAIAAGSKTKNTVLSGLTGIGLGLFGIGIPDIPLFTATLLKSLYQIALSYGYDYDKPEEKYFILLIISGGVQYGDELREADGWVNYFIENGIEPSDEIMKKEIKRAAEGLSKELLYMKFLQGIPIVGAAGGAYDAIYVDRITKYAHMKYNRRFLYDIKK